MRYSVDRIEPCGCVVLVNEAGERKTLPQSDIGFCPKEGDVLVRGEDGAFSLDNADAEARRKRLNGILQRILRRKD